MYCQPTRLTATAQSSCTSSQPCLSEAPADTKQEVEPETTSATTLGTKFTPSTKDQHCNQSQHSNMDYNYTVANEQPPIPTKTTSKHFTLLTWNVGGLRTSKAFLEVIAAEEQPDVMTIQEPATSTQKKQVQAKITGYTCIKTSQYVAHHNVYTYIKRGVDFTRLNKGQVNNHPADSYQIGIKHCDTPITVTNIYRNHQAELDTEAIENL